MLAAGLSILCMQSRACSSATSARRTAFWIFKLWTDPSAADSSTLPASAEAGDCCGALCCGISDDAAAACRGL